MAAGLKRDDTRIRNELDALLKVMVSYFLTLKQNTPTLLASLRVMIVSRLLTVTVTTLQREVAGPVTCTKRPVLYELCVLTNDMLFDLTVDTLTSRFCFHSPRNSRVEPRRDLFSERHFSLQAPDPPPLFTVTVRYQNCKIFTDGERLL